MPEETVVAATSAEQEAPATTAPEFDHSRGALVDLSPEQRSEYKKTGVLPKAPEPKKTEEVAPPQPEPKGESAAEAEPAKGKQEHTEKQPKKPTAEERIAQLEATIEKIRKGAGIERKAEPAPAPVEPKAENAQQQPKPPQNYKEWFKQFDAETWENDYVEKNPTHTFSQMNAALADYLGDVREEFARHAEAQRASLAKTSEKLQDAEKRYGAKFDDVVVPTLKAINEKIVPPIRQLLEECEVLPDLLFTIGDEQGGIDKFLAMPPGKQARYIALTEALIQEQLSGKAEEVKPEPPAKPQTSAPKPPAEVGGRASTPDDPLVSAAKAGDYRRFSAESTRQALARLKG